MMRRRSSSRCSRKLIREPACASSASAPTAWPSTVGGGSVRSCDGMLVVGSASLRPVLPAGDRLEVGGDGGVGRVVDVGGRSGGGGGRGRRRLRVLAHTRSRLVHWSRPVHRSRPVHWGRPVLRGPLPALLAHRSRLPALLAHRSRLPALLGPDFLIERVLQLVRGALEFVDAATQGAAQLGQFLRAKHDQGHDENDEQFRNTQVHTRSFGTRSGGGVFSVYRADRRAPPASESARGLPTHVFALTCKTLKPYHR